ncbi:GNAT family N-acetyltransferase [Vibrio nigripulchritudo]|nr:GNAT family N-acetyltransferase [Vibrio nigripulchritudo]BDU30613.1 GNAT family N-acetyltransferase [Vibrio nigripulchritudo]
MIFTIRKALIADVKDIADIHVSSWKVAFEGQMPQGYIDEFTTSSREAEWFDIIEKQQEIVYVAQEDSKIMGFLSFYISAESTQTIELSKLYLCPKVYQRGIGQKLMTHLEKMARGMNIKQLSLYVLDCNQNAINFYKKHGFEFDSGSETTWHEGEKIVDVQMTKTLY